MALSLQPAPGQGLSRAAGSSWSVGPTRGFGDLGRMAIYFQGAGEQW